MDLRAALADVVGGAHVLVDRDAVAGHEVDWTGRWRGRATAVVRPASTEEVAGVLRACADAGAGVVVQGGNTGLVGGAVPGDGDVVLSTRRLDAVGPVDVARREVVVGAGTTLAALQRHAAVADLDAGLDLAARDAATVGGLVATDAGGTRVVRHGSAGRRVAGLVAVTSDGSVLRDDDGRVARSSTGPDLARVLVGSEGVLAVVTEVRWRLAPRPARAVVVALGVADAAAAVALLPGVRAAAGTALAACELVLRPGIDLVVDACGADDPVPGAGALVLVEVVGEDPDALEAAAGRLVALEGVRREAVALDEPDRRRLWEVRERHTEAVATLGVPHKLDVAVPLPALAGLLATLPALVAEVAPGAALHVWGHLAEGNLHVNVVGPPPGDDAADRAVYAAVADLGGTISAEHGIGRAKADQLHLVRSPAGVALLRRLKVAFDPDALLGRGVLLPPDGDGHAP